MNRKSSLLIRSLLALLLLSLPATADAHTAISGVGDFFGGALHPLMTPTHLLVLLALGLLAAQHSSLRGSIGLAGALSLLVFFALAMQCTSTLATVKRETNSWRWPLFQLVYMSAVAYSMAWITFHLSLWFLQG